MYKKEHQRIAPDLRDGIPNQSTSTDVYSFGRVVNRIFIHSSSMEELVKKCLCYSSSNRPTISEIIISCFEHCSCIGYIAATMDYSI